MTADVTALLAEANSLASARDILLPEALKFGAVDNHIAGYRQAQAELRALLDRYASLDTEGEERLSDEDRDSVTRIRSRWSNGPTGRYPEATEAADQRDIEILLALVDRLARPAPAAESEGDEVEALTTFLRAHCPHVVLGATWWVECLASECTWSANGDSDVQDAYLAHLDHVSESLVAAGYSHRPAVPVERIAEVTFADGVIYDPVGRVLSVDPAWLVGRVTEVTERVLAEHQIEDRGDGNRSWTCTAGDWERPYYKNYPNEHHRAHQAAAVAAELGGGA